jgi:hypothetical protein
MRLLSVSAGLALAFLNACSSPERSGHSELAKHHDTFEARRGRDDARLISLADSLAPLRDHFNADKGKPRLVTLLSPT